MEPWFASTGIWGVKSKGWNDASGYGFASLRLESQLSATHQIAFERHAWFAVQVSWTYALIPAAHDHFALTLARRLARNVGVLIRARAATNGSGTVRWLITSDRNESRTTVWIYTAIIQTGILEIVTTKFSRLAFSATARYGSRRSTAGTRARRTRRTRRTR